jgi:murein DD-endopeptidase MepM/ murein hydrolase activator NlpD
MRVRVLVAGVVLPAVLWALLPIGTAAAPRLSNIQHKIEVTQGLIGRKRGTERLLTTQISAYNRRISSLQGRISGVTTREIRVQADLDRKRSELQRLQSELRFQRARLVRLRARLEVARKTLARRLVEIYESDRPDIVTVILNSKGFADLLEREDFIRRISDQDRRIIDIVATARVDATDAAHRLAGLEARQQRITAAVLARRNELAQIRGQLIGTRVGYQKTRAGKAAALAATQEKRHVLEGRLDDLQAEEAKIQGALNGAARGFPSLPAGPIRGSGQFIWPVNGPITSPFCERRAWEACHPGIDIGVPSGTPIRAAAGGKVTLLQSAGVSGGYGNYTCVSHTSSLSTCYAHQSSFKVSLGQSVSQGQVIGISGCTGLCFGAHLHFEVRINGSVTNPLNYL